MKTEMRTSLFLLALLMLAGCASERVVLLPSPDGRATAVVVRDARGETVLDRPYAASVRQLGATNVYRSTPEDVEKRFGPALAAQPARPRSYVLYFEEGGNVLTAESQAEFARVRSEIVAWAAPEVMVIGHTDRVGSAQSNDTLSLTRAEAVRTLLIEAGLPGDQLEAVGRGEREPLVPTADEVAEAKNRRVEINLR